MPSQLPIGGRDRAVIGTTRPQGLLWRQRPLAGLGASWDLPPTPVAISPAATMAAPISARSFDEPWPNLVSDSGELDHSEELGSGENDRHLHAESYGQVLPLRLIGDTGGAAHRKDRPPRCPRGVDE